MPDLLYRQQHEEQIAYGVAGILARQKEQLLAYGVNRLDSRSDSDWKNDEDSLTAILVLLLARPWEQASFALAEDFDVRRTPPDVRTDYMKWSSEYARDTAAEITTTTRKLAAEAAAEVERARGLRGKRATGADGATLFAPGSPEFEAEQSALRLDALNVTDRATTIAVTSTTDTAFAAECATAREIERHLNVKLTAYWVTEDDGKVCPICAKKHNKPIPNNDFRAAHPRCRCWAEWRIDRGGN